MHVCIRHRVIQSIEFFNKASLQDESGQPYISGPEPILTFEVNIKGTNNENPLNKNPKFYYDRLTRSMFAYSDHFETLANQDTNVFDEIENGHYLIRFIIYGKDGEIYSKDKLITKIEDEHVKVIDYDSEYVE